MYTHTCTRKKTFFEKKSEKAFEKADLSCASEILISAISKD